MERKRGKRNPDELNDEGCLQLIGAVIRQALEDHLRARGNLPDRSAERLLRETSAFFRSPRFRRLTGPYCDEILRLLRKEVDPDDPA